MGKPTVFDEPELILGCKCGKKPTLSTYTFEYISNFHYSCCRIGRKGRSAEEAANYWNQTNATSEILYKKNNVTKQWEIIKREKNEES